MVLSYWGVVKERNKDDAELFGCSKAEKKRMRLSYLGCSKAGKQITLVTTRGRLSRCVSYRPCSELYRCHKVDVDGVYITACRLLHHVRGCQTGCWLYWHKENSSEC